MKKIIFGVLFVVLLFSHAIFPIAHFKLGLEHTGFVFSWEGNEEWGRMKTFRVGTGFTSLYERKFVFQPELYFVQKGAETSGDFMGNPLTKKVRLNYLELPMLFRLSVLSRNKINVGLFFGPYASVLLSASQVTTYIDDNRIEDIKKDFKKTDFGSVFGIEIVLTGKKLNYFIDIRFTSGLTNIRENRDFQDSIKTRSFSLLAGIGF